MRDILFRGKRLSDGEWVYGSALPHDNDACTIFRQHPLTGEPEGFEVDPDTVGQYTGLTDKNGQKVFEGDILEAYDPDDKHGNFKKAVIVGWDNDFSQFLCEEILGQTSFILRTVINGGKGVIGNFWGTREVIKETVEYLKMREDGDDEQD